MNTESQVDLVQHLSLGGYWRVSSDGTVWRAGRGKSRAEAGSWPPLQTEQASLGKRGPSEIWGRAAPNS